MPTRHSERPACGRRRVAAFVGCLAVLAGSTSCRTDHGSPAADARGPGQAVVVASFNFPESRLLAEIYAQVLEARGLTVRRQFELGPRELVLPALHEGLVDVVPEYLGSAVNALAPGAIAANSDPTRAVAALRAALGAWHVAVLDPAAAQDQNGFAVTGDTARRLSLRTLSDVRTAAPRMTIAGPFECRTRTYCLPGLARVYGLHFARFLALDTEDQRATALAEGVVDMAVMFTTDGRLATGDFVLLADDRRLQPPENIVPVVSERALARHGEQLAAALNAVSAKLTSRSLTLLNWRTALAHRDPTAEAYGWLRRQGLVARPSGRATGPVGT